MIEPMPIAFVFVCAVSTFLGVYTLLQNPKSGVNVVFTLMCGCMALWSFGFSVAIKAPTLAECLTGRRIAAGGWSLLFGIVVHFGLLLIREKGIAVRRWVYVPIYVPAAVMLYVFCLSDQMAEAQYNMVLTPLGWVNVAVNNGWDYLLYAYFAVCFLTTFLLIRKWASFADDITEAKQAKLISIACAASVLLGSTDIFFNSLFKDAYLPQMAPIAFLIPLATVSYCIKKYRFLNHHQPNDLEIVLANSNQSMAYNYLSFAYFAGSFVYYFTQYVMQPGTPLMTALAPSLLLFFVGLVIQWLTRLNIGRNMQEVVYVAAVTLSIPAVTLQFIDYGSVTVWAFPFVTLVFAMLFRRQIVLVCTAVSMLATQVIVWILKPQVLVQINSVDYSARIGIFLIAVWVAFYAHKAYVLRLRENEEQIRRQKLISDISFEMGSAGRKNERDKMQELFRRIGDFFQADSVRFVPCVPGEDYPAYCWLCPGTAGVLLDQTGIRQADMADIRETVIIGDGFPVPQGRPALAEKLAGEGIGSLISVPVSVKEEVVGHLRLETIRRDAPWRSDYLELLKILSNITADTMDKVRTETKVHFLAYYDNLTGLPNRALFKDRTEQAISLAQRTERTIAVIFLDLDGFKSINDTMGHQGGDHLIREVASQLVKCLRKTDTVARFGGDEFVVMVNHLADAENIQRIMETVMGLFSRPFIVHGQEMFVTGSAGVAMYPVDGTDTDTLVKSADIAMYHAKDKGKNQYVLCSPHMREEIQLKMRLTNSLYRALDRHELVVHYQPQIDLPSGKIVGMEALLRWRHPEIGMVPPGIFIPLAEQSGLINNIGEWVLYEACRQNKQWQMMGLPRMRVAVNISVNQFRNPNLVGQVKQVLEITKLDPQDLELEITEGIAIKEAGYIVSVLNELKKLNVCISIDDFGTEYSSLSRLKLLPVDRIKMDMQFVREIEHSDKDKAISQVIINLAKSLGMKVIAEGVETQGQLDFLVAKECDEVQGYYYYLPMPGSEVESAIRSHGRQKQAEGQVSSGVSV